MKYLLGLTLLVSGIAFAQPVSYKDSLQQMPCKKKKKKGCGCGGILFQKKEKIEVA